MVSTMPVKTDDWFTRSYNETSFAMGDVPIVEIVELDKKGKRKKVKRRPLRSALYALPVFAFTPMTALAEGTTTVPQNEEMQEKMMKAFLPIIELAQAMAYPVALLVVLGGGLLVLIGKSDKGFDMMQRAGLGYVLVMILPMLLNVLVDAMQSMV